MKTKNLLDNIFFIPSLIFLIKWFIFFNLNYEIDFITKILFSLKDWQYFTLILNMSNLDFNPSYNPDLSSLKFISFPIYSIIFHSLFFSIFNVYSFIVIEFLIILLFFYIFLSFFKKLGLEKIEALFITLLIFCLPSIIDYFNLDTIPYIGSIKSLYNLRIPSPSISHLYLFLFFLLLIPIKKNTQFRFRQLALVGLIFALMWGSFYYNLAIAGTTFSIFYFYIIFNNNQKIPKYIKDIFVVLIFFSFFSIPLVLILLKAEPDYLIRVGLIELDLPKKKILLMHFIEKILSVKYIIVFSIITFLYFNLKIKNIYKIEGINLLYIIFLSSFLAPIFFILVSPTISEVYHFSDMIVALTFFIFIIFSFLFLSIFIKKIIWYKYTLNVAVFLLLFIYGLDNYSLNKNNSFNKEMINSNELFKEIEKININKDSPVLSFDSMVQTNLVLNNYINLSIIDGVNIPLNDEMLEDNLISIFKFLNLDTQDFKKFIQNEKKNNWRFINKNIGRTFYMKYQANNLSTYMNSKDFSSKELKSILDSSPLHSQQLIIPNFELVRLTNKFDNFSINKYPNPELIIINFNDNFTRNLKLNDTIYCSKKINQTYKIYFFKNNNSTC